VNLLQGTEEFMRKAGQLDRGPEFGDYDSPERSLRRDLLREEMQEYLLAERLDDLAEVCDGLLDIIVVAWGTLLSYVGSKTAVKMAAEVVRSNLTKVNGPGLPIFANGPGSKVVKPPTFEAPRIAEILGGQEVA
jgi:hypothetical protein